MQPKNNVPDDHLYRLLLFVAGNEPNSLKAKEVLFHFCEKYLHGRCEIKIVDVYDDYQTAIYHQVIIVPTLIVLSPPPVRTIAGSLKDEKKLLFALGITDRGIQS
jgi:circadian clock protein KaiB